MRPSRKSLLHSALLSIPGIFILIFIYYYDNNVFLLVIIQSVFFVLAGINLGFAACLNVNEEDAENDK